jgi:hypothetical protein
MLWWRNTSNLLRCNIRSNQVSAPHKSRFIGMALKRRYLLYMSRWKLRPTSFRAPVEAFAVAIHTVMSLLLLIVGNEQAQVSKTPREAGEAIDHLESLCIVQLVIHYMLTFCLPWVVLFFVGGGINRALSIGIICC